MKSLGAQIHFGWLRVALGLAVASLLVTSTPAGAASKVTIVAGTQSRAFHDCLQALTNAVSEGEDCGYGPTENNQGAPFGEVIGPLTQGYYYSETNAPFPFTNANGIATAGATGYVQIPGDGKIEPSINGTVTVDDNGTSADGSDDLISFTLTWTDPLGGRLIRHLGNAVVERYTSMNQVLTGWPVDSAAPNGSGGFDYLIGSLGFPGRIQFLDTDGVGGDADFTACDGQLFGDAECRPSFGAGVVNAQKWNPAAGANWVAHQAAVGLGTLEGNHGAQTTGTVTNIECVDASDGPLGADVDQAGGAAAQSDCDDSKIAFAASLIGDCVDFPTAPTATTGCVQIDMDVGFDNLLLKVSTNASGSVISAEGFDVQETVVFGATDECGDMTHNGTGSGPGGLGGPGLQPFCNVWISGYFTLATAGVQAADDSGVTEQDLSVTIDVLANDTNFADPLTVTVAADPANGNAVVNGSPGNRADIDITYTPNAGFIGTDSFDYTVMDNNGEMDTGTVTVTVADPNVPVTSDDTASAIGLNPVNVDVLANDRGLNDTPIELAVTSGPADGTAVVQPDNTITYTSNSNAGTPDTLEYTVTDFSADTDTATVTVNRTMQSPTSITTPVSGTQSKAFQACLQQLTVSVGDGENCMYDGGPSNNPDAVAFGESVGPFTEGFYYDDAATPEAFSASYVPTVGDDKIAPLMNGAMTVNDAGTPGIGTDDRISFTLTMTSPGGGKVIRYLRAEAAGAVAERFNNMTQTLSPTVVSSATANLAGGFDYIIGSEGFPNLLTFGGDPMFSECAGQLFGSVECNPSFTAGVVDPLRWMGWPATAGIGSLESNYGTRLTSGSVNGLECVDTGTNNDCNDSSVAYSPSVFGCCANKPEDVAWDNLLLKVSTNASGEVLTVEGFDVQETQVFGSPFTACGTEPGAEPDFGCNTWVAGNFFLAGPSAGIAVDDEVNTNQDEAASIDVLTNDTGFTDPVTVVATTPANGTTQVNGSPGNQADIDITYSPNPGFTGADIFSYAVTDNDGKVDTATVTVHVGGEARNDTLITRIDTPVSINPLANDIGFSDPVTVTITTLPAHGTAGVTGSPGGQSGIRINYTPAAAYQGPDMLVYQVTDGMNTGSATVFITVAADAVDDQFVVVNDFDANLFIGENDIGFSDPVNVTIISFPTNGSSVHLHNTPGPKSSVYAHFFPHCCQGNYTDSFRYQISDGTSTDTATVTVEIVAFQARDDTALASQAAPVAIDVLENDLGFNYPAIVGIFTTPQHGTAVVNGSPGFPGGINITYTSHPDFLGVDTFQYAVDDGTQIDIATVTVTVVLDTDLDSVANDSDNCVEVANTNQRDTNLDGYGNVCDGDLDNSGMVNFADLSLFRQRFASNDPDADFDGNGVVNFGDLARFRTFFGEPPGPSALAPQ